MRRFIEIFAVFFMISATVSLAQGGRNAAGRLDQFATDPLNATYLIEGTAVRLMDGRCDLPAAPGSAMKIRTAVWGLPVYGDMDGDGDKDATLLLTHDPGGSGTFYYVAAAINVNGGYQGTNAVLLGDRIAPMDIGIRNGAVVVNYADRRPEEPMSARPTVDKTIQLILKNDKLDSAGPPESVDPASSPQKITFDLTRLDDDGLYGAADAKRTLAYEFCIPDTPQNRAEVKRIDPTVKFFAESPGRIGCGKCESLCIGSTYQRDFRRVLQRLAELTYVQRIDESFFE
jgi:hypothetical protein